MATVNEVTSQAIADIIEYYKPVGGKISQIDANIQQRGLNVLALGAKADGSDDTVAIQNAINSLTSGIVVLPAYTFIVTSLAMKDGVYLHSLGATLKLKDNAAPNTYLVDFNGVKNCGISGTLTLEGNRNSQVNTGESGAMGLHITKGCKNICLGTVYINNFQNDGFYVGGEGETPQNIFADSIVIDSAGRNAVSITNAQDVFIKTLITANTLGVAPQDGVDIEPNSVTDIIKNINIDMLHTYGNAGYGIGVIFKDIYTQGDVTIKQISSHDNDSGVRLEKSAHVSILSGSIYGNTTYGVDMPRDNQHIKICAEIFKNGRRGINLATATQTAQTLDIDLQGSRVFNNSQTTANMYDGIMINSDDAAKPVSNVNMRNVMIFDDQITPTQRYGLNLQANTDSCVFDGIINGNASGQYVNIATLNKVAIGQYTLSATLDFPSMPAYSTAELTIAAIGIVGGDVAYASPTVSPPAGVVWSAYCKTGVVVIRLANITNAAIDPASSIWKAHIVRF